MSFLRVQGRKFILFLTVCITVILVTYVRGFFILPSEITLLEGEEDVYSFTTPFLTNIRIEKEGMIELLNKGKRELGTYISLSNPVFLKSRSNGTVNMDISLLGLITFKTVKVDVVEKKSLAACGNTVGVKMTLDGILVLAISDVQGPGGIRQIPARDSGIKAGDIIKQINGEAAESIEMLINEIDNSKGRPIEIKFKRGETYGTAVINPVKSSEDGKYRIGMWVRDNTAGIGTLTFFDPDSGSFGALGHGITDIDTGILMPVSQGEILESNILGIKKGEVGHPGELKGVFIEDNKLGTIRKNCEFGIYGELSEFAMSGNLKGKLYPIAVRSQIKEGPAQILSNIDGKIVELYDIEIQKVSRQSLNGSKGMVLKITDEKLLRSTGGIVQGMSGSPIIQNGRIIGAVTHVLVNDPTRGYGIFIEGMLKNTTDGMRTALLKAG